MGQEAGSMEDKKATKQIQDCLVCGRPFLIIAKGEGGAAGLRLTEWGLAKERCAVHCTAPCCRAAKCQEAKPTVRSVRTTRTCSVCHRPRWMFVRFAPCSDECTFMQYRSTRRVICMVHRPTAKPRIHIDYCSLEHYNDWEKGHRERTLGGRRVRWRRHRDEKLSQARFRREKERRS